MMAAIEPNERFDVSKDRFPTIECYTLAQL